MLAINHSFLVRLLKWSIRECLLKYFVTTNEILSHIELEMNHSTICRFINGVQNRQRYQDAMFVQLIGVIKTQRKKSIEKQMIELSIWIRLFQIYQPQNI